MSTSDQAAAEFHLDAAAERIGTEHGKRAGSWVIDGNTSTDRAQAIIDGYNDGDPEFLDMAPSPLSGEWADGLTESAVIEEIADAVNVDATTIGEEHREELIGLFEDSYSDGFWTEVLRAAAAIVPATVRAVLAEAEYDATNSSVVSVSTVRMSSSRHAGLDDMDVLVFSGAKRDSRMSDVDPMDLGNYRALEAMGDDWSELRCASPYSDATYFALAMDDRAPEGLIDVIRGLENYPVIDESLMWEAEQELAEEHWDSYGRYDARVALVAALANELDVDTVDVDLEDVFGDVDVDTLLDDRVVSREGDGRYPEYIAPSAFEFHSDAIAADVIADMRAWLTAEYNNGQGELF